jgi:hypothetical protein
MGPLFSARSLYCAEIRVTTPKITPITTVYNEILSVIISMPNATIQTMYERKLKVIAERFVVNFLLAR